MKKTIKVLAAVAVLSLSGCAATTQSNSQATVSTYEVPMSNDLLAQQPASWGYVGEIIKIDSEQTYVTTVGNKFEVKYVPVLVEITEGPDLIGQQIWYQLNTNVGADYDLATLQVGKTVVVQATQEQFERDGGRKLAPVNYIGVVGDDGVIINVRAGDKLDMTLDGYREVLGL
jgi:hypothetical protein